MRSIVQYWHSEDVPEEVRDLTASFREKNPEMRHRLFHEEEAAEFIAEHLTKREVDAFRACAVPAMQADYFRCCAILALGGLYADVSLVCRRPLGPLLDEVDSGLLVRLAPSEVIYNGFFAFAAPGHPFLRLALDVTTSNIERRIANSVNRVTGPLVFTCLAEAHRLGGFDSAWAPDPWVADLVEGMYEEVGSYERVSAAFEGVRIEPRENIHEWAIRSPARLEYKESDTHWPDWAERKGSIFR